MRSWTRAFLFLLLGACADVGDAESAAEIASDEGAVDGELDPSLPVLAVENGVPVRGAGPNQQWEGIVMTMQSVGRGMGSCSASFISGQHLVTAAHCYGRDGAQRVQVRAPTWNGGGWQTFERAVVQRASTNNSIDIAVVNLGSPVAWATPQRRFVLNAGAAPAADLYVYGYGAASETGGNPGGQLRAAPGRATVRITDAGGYLVSTARVARVCSGDSGGPALKEGTSPVLWGINQSFTVSRQRSFTDRQPICPESNAQMRFTDVGANLAFVERALGFRCKRLQVDGQQVAQCW